jgi:23S rRNA (pseudouridine1915-N3)-methyltransferase
MRVEVLAVGPIKRGPWRELLDDYGRRLGHYTRFSERELRDGSDADVEGRFRKHLDPRGTTVALEVGGETVSSAALAKLLERAQLSGTASLQFLIGGSYGLPSTLSQCAHRRLSLGPMTLPHRLARLVLFEQLYRGFTILRGEPYDH